MTKTAVYLDEKESKVFILLAKAHAFEVSNGSVEVFFDERGEPMKAKTSFYSQLSTPRFDEVLTVVV